MPCRLAAIPAFLVGANIASPVAYAQRISGHIIEQGTGRAVAGALVTLVTDSSRVAAIFRGD